MGGTGGIGGVGGVVTLGQPELSVQLDSAVIWLAADSITGKSDDDTITTWTNAGTSVDFTEATNPPTYKTSIQNSLPVVRFDGLNDTLTAADADAMDFNGTGFSIYVVYQSTVDPLGLLCHYGAGAAGWGFAQGHGATAGTRLCVWTQQGGAWAEDNAALGDANFHCGSVTVTAAGTYQFYQDNVAGATSDGYDLSGIADTSTYLGADGSGGSLGAVDIAEVLAWNSPHSAAQASLVNNYLIAKWAV